MKVFRESLKINCNNLLGSFSFRVKLKGREDLTKTFQASPAPDFVSQDRPLTLREGNVVMCLRTCRMEALPFFTS